MVENRPHIFLSRFLTSISLLLRWRVFCVTYEGNLRSLVQLELRENFLLNLPDSICELEKLKHIDLEDNRLDHLPEDFGSLSNLEELLLDKNHLTQLPISFGYLK